MRKIGKHIAFFILTLLSVRGFAQDTRVYASVDKNPVEVGEVFSYRITVENGRGDITPPPLGDFNLIFGPSRSQNYSYYNGQSTSTLTQTYTLRPVKEGKYTIEPGKVKVDDKWYKTDPIVLEVIKGSRPAPSSNQNSAQPQTSQQASQNVENIQLKIELSKRKAYIGEQIVIQYVLLTRYNNLDVVETKLPTLNGFWTETVEKDAAWEQNYEIINGMRFKKAVLQTQILIPQRKGKIQIDPVEITTLVNRSIFNRGTQFNVKSNSPTIEILPHSGNAPKSYDGAVGQFDYKVEFSTFETQANEAINLNIGISGLGNLSLIEAPKIKFPSDFEVYDPEINDRIKVTESGVRGSRNFQYLIIPRYPGEYEIPAFEFTFFHPTKKKYVTETAGPFEFKIKGDGGQVTTDSGIQRAKNRVTQSGKDIRYILTNPKKLQSKDNSFFGSTAHYGFLGAPFLILLMFLLARKREQERNKDLTVVKMRGAGKLAKRRLKAADTAMKEGRTQDFYREVFKALFGYLSDRLSIASSELTRHNIEKELLERGVTMEEIDTLNSTLDSCEMARFAPVTGMSEEEFYNQAATLIEKLENSIQK